MITELDTCTCTLFIYITYHDHRTRSRWTLLAVVANKQAQASIRNDNVTAYTCDARSRICLKTFSMFCACVIGRGLPPENRQPTIHQIGCALRHRSAGRTLVISNVMSDATSATGGPFGCLFCPPAGRRCGNGRTSARWKPHNTHTRSVCVCWPHTRHMLAAMPAHHDRNGEVDDGGDDDDRR